MSISSEVGLPNFLRKYLDVSENSGTPKSSILIGFSIIYHPFWGTPIFGNIHLYLGCGFVPVRVGLHDPGDWHRGRLVNFNLTSSESAYS